MSFKYGRASEIISHGLSCSLEIYYTETCHIYKVVILVGKLALKVTVLESVLEYFILPIQKCLRI